MCWKPALRGLAPPRHYSGRFGSWKKAVFHGDMQQSITDLVAYRRPDLTVMDASVGLADYHLNQNHLGDGDGVLLFPHFQGRIVPNWFDRYVSRLPAPAVLANVLQVFPTETFLARLPGGRIPTRQDFIDYADHPDQRITRWRTAATESDRLGDQLLIDLERGRIPDLLEGM